MKCPLCSGKMTICEDSQKFKYGESFSKTKLLYGLCSKCKEKINIPSKNQKLIKNAINNARVNDTIRALELINKRECFSDVERALKLPQRTLSKWKNREIEPSSAASALIEFINLFPWLIEIANTNFDKKLSNTIAIDSIIREELNNSGNYCIRAENYSKLFGIVSINKEVEKTSNASLPFRIGGIK